MNWVSLRRGAILESLLGLLHRPAAAAARSGGPAKSGTAAKTKTVSMAVLAQLHALLSAHGDGIRDPSFCVFILCASVAFQSFSLSQQAEISWLQYYPFLNFSDIKLPRISSTTCTVVLLMT